jgi:hypothetical protein
MTLVQCSQRLMEEKIWKCRVFLNNTNRSKKVVRKWKMMKEVIVQYFREPMIMFKKWRIWCIQTFKYHRSLLCGNTEAITWSCAYKRPNDSILHHDNAPAHKALSVKHFLAQKSITEMEQPSCSPDLAQFPKIKSALKGRRFQDTIKKCDCAESYYTATVPEVFPTVRRIAQLLKGSTSKVTPLSKL